VPQFSTGRKLRWANRIDGSTDLGGQQHHPPART
jgi:hypothetical protein